MTPLVHPFIRSFDSMVHPFIRSSKISTQAFIRSSVHPNGLTQAFIRSSVHPKFQLKGSSVHPFIHSFIHLWRA
jgi:hypothetical protein